MNKTEKIIILAGLGILLYFLTREANLSASTGININNIGHIFPSGQWRIDRNRTFNNPQAHTGIDIIPGYNHGDTYIGTPILAPFDGYVIQAREGRNGYYTILMQRPTERNFTERRRYGIMFAHLLEQPNAWNKQVRKGEIIGKIGKSGYTQAQAATFPAHVHLTLWKDGRRVDPLSDNIVVQALGEYLRT